MTPLDGDLREIESIVPTRMYGANTKYLVSSYIVYLWALNYLYGRDDTGAKVVMDAACGTLYGTHLLSTLSHRVVAVDRSREFIDWGRQRYVPLCPVDYVLWDLEGGLPPVPVDAVVSIETLEHLRDPVPFLDDIRSRNLPLIFHMPIEAPSDFHPHSYTQADIARLMPGCEMHVMSDTGEIDSGKADYAFGAYVP